MNRNGRVVGGVLIGIALLWLLSALNVFSFNNRSTNQVSANTPADRPPVADPNAVASNTDSTLPPTGTQPFNPPSNTTPTQPNTTANNGTGTGTGQTSATGNNTPPSASTLPAVRAGW